MTITLNGTTGITTPDITSAAGLDASDINDNAITAAKLHTTAVTDKLGYTPVTPTEFLAATGQTIQSSPTDFDQATAIGRTYNTANNNATNGPTGNNTYFQIHVLNSIEGVTQFTKAYASNGTWYVRSSYRGTFSAWRTAF